LAEDKLLFWVKLSFLFSLLSSLTIRYELASKPFVWCMAHNFGGNSDLFGNLTHISFAPVEARMTPGNTMARIPHLARWKASERVLPLMAADECHPSLDWDWSHYGGH